MSDSFKVYASQEYVENKIEESRVQPDWSQNDPTAADYINGKTHWAEAVFNIEWDGDISGLARYRLTSGDGPAGLYGPIPFDGSIDDLIGATVKMKNDNEYIITARGMNNAGNGLSFHSADGQFILAYTTEDYTSVNNVTWTGSSYAYVGLKFSISTAGLYLWYNGQDDRVLSVNKETIYTLDEKFIPDSIAHTEDVPDDDHINSLIDVKAADKVPITRTVNGKVLSDDIALTASDVGAAESSHTQAASTITAGTFAGAVVAQTSSQTPGTSLLRNSKLVTTETNPSYNGEICWTYE
jgi:hypothetical protein